MQKLPILIVDDEAEMLTILLRTLRRSGFSVESASNGAEALRLFKKKSFSLVITDFRMPQMSGIELLRNVKKLTPDIPVIMITGYGTVNNAVEAMQHGAADYLLKPFSSQTLQAAIKKVGIHPNGNGRSKSGPANGGLQTAGKRIITADPKVLKLLTMAKSVAPSKATVLIQGESGTGKELLAAYIHRHSSQQEKPYIAVNCAALPDTLAESELFGHEKGAFTGAVNRKTGKFELAADGTLVMDEISEMTLPLQAKILRVLQERQIDRVGGGQPIPIDARIIAISNVDYACLNRYRLAAPNPVNLSFLKYSQYFGLKRQGHFTYLIHYQRSISRQFKFTGLAAHRSRKSTFFVAEKLAFR